MGGICMDISIKNDVINMYFNNHLKIIEIAEYADISLASISRIIKTDTRYVLEKENRTIKSKEKHKATNKLYMKKQREERKIAEEYYVLEELHNQAVRELSKNKHLSNESYRKWNTSAYLYNDEKRRFEFKPELGRAADIPKYIKVKI